MSAITDELKSWKDELEAIASGLLGTLDLAVRNGVDRAQLDDLQEVIDNTKSVCMDLGAVIRGIETATDGGVCHG